MSTFQHQNISASRGGQWQHRCHSSTGSLCVCVMRQIGEGAGSIVSDKEEVESKTVNQSVSTGKEVESREADQAECKGMRTESRGADGLGGWIRVALGEGVERISGTPAKKVGPDCLKKYISEPHESGELFNGVDF